MSKLLLLALLAALASCATRPPSMEASRPARHYYRHRQHVHERERRRQVVIVVFHPKAIA